jgi:hypothetical protein
MEHSRPLEPFKRPNLQIMGTQEEKKVKAEDIETYSIA